MLKTALVAMTVMGCDCDSRICLPVDAPSRQFASVGECESAIVALMQTGSDEYPLLEARCTPVGLKPAPLVAEATEEERTVALTGDSSRDQGLLVHGLDYAVLAGSYVLYRTADGILAVRGGLGVAYDRAARSAGDAASWVVGSQSGGHPF